MMRTTRRQMLAGSMMLPAVPVIGASSSAADAPVSIAGDLETYIAFGNKQSGGSGDARCGEWMAGELEAAGYAIERINFDAPWFEPERCELACGDESVTLWPQPIVVPTPDAGIAAPLVRVGPDGGADAPLPGAIALVDLPWGRWSSLYWPQVRTPLQAAFDQGARAAVVVTNGPTDEVIALNADGREPMFPGPVALLAPREAGPFLAAAREHRDARLVVTGQGGRRPAFNFVGRIDRGRGNWLVVSTPRSGWFDCAGERGGGVAAWLHIARWAARDLHDHNLAFLCNSGHEYQYLGAAESMRHIAPPPQETAFWLHLGANLAAREWHDSVGGRRPLSATDAQRYLVVTSDLLPAARARFAGLSGLEDAYSSDQISAGELTAVLEAGYSPAAGIFGVHRFHHVAQDDARCVSPAAVAETTAAFVALVRDALA